MGVTILSFGQLASITGSRFAFEASSTDVLVAALKQQFQELEQIKFVLAVNKNITTHDTILADGDTVALLPPFSGG